MRSEELGVRSEEWRKEIAGGDFLKLKMQLRGGIWMSWERIAVKLYDDDVAFAWQSNISNAIYLIPHSRI